MRFMKVLGGAGLALASWGIAVPVATAADRAEPARPAATTSTARPAIVDVALDAQGNLSGKVLNAQGKAVDGASVIVRQGTREVARAETSAAGEFQVAGLRGGVYQIGTDKQAGTFRVWTKKAAPPSARETALVVSKPQGQVVRGQVLGGGEPGVVVGTTGVVMANNANNNAEDAQDDADAANAALNALINKKPSTAP